MAYLYHCGLKCRPRPPPAAPGRPRPPPAAPGRPGRRRAGPPPLRDMVPTAPAARVMLLVRRVGADVEVARSFNIRQLTDVLRCKLQHHF